MPSCVLRENKKGRMRKMEKQRIYFVIDMKSFFASVECAERGLDPFTANLVVADPERSRGTICLAVSPAMKKLGVKNRCRLFEIPDHIDYIIAPPRMKKYIEYASKIYEIYLKYIDKRDIHVYSIDECFIDVTDYLKLYGFTAKEFAKKLMSEIENTVHVPSSVGIGTNMFLSKIALDITAKHSPDRVGYLDEDLFKKTLWHHRPITDFWQISTGIANRLLKYNIIDMCGIAHFNEDVLYKEFGINAELLIDHAWGRETCTIADIKNYKCKAKSISSSQILPCNYNYKDALVVMLEMLQNGCYDLMRQNYITSNVKIFVGYGDQRGDFDAGSIKMLETTNLYSAIYPYVKKTFENIVNKKRPIRKIGYDFFDLQPDTAFQCNFFTDNTKIEKEKRLVKSVIGLQDKYGKNAVLKGIDLCENATQRERNQMIGGHSSGEKQNA